VTDSFDAYVFDHDGTLVDYTSLGSSCASFAPQPESFALAWRPKQTVGIAAWSHLPAYADVVPAFLALRARGAKTAILSNGTPPSIATMIENANIAKYFGAVLSVDAVRRFKPHPSVCDLVVHRCNRGPLPAETMGAKPTRVIASLAEFVD
jgi:FMN phosphatase YigB (HAD superfamily)